MTPGGGSAVETGARRLEANAISNLRSAQRRFIDADCATIDRLPVDKSVARSGGHCARIVRVGVVEIVVVNVDVVDVGDPRVGDVHVAEVVRAAVIPRMERLTETERKPTDSAAPAAAKAESYSEMTAANEADERRTIEGPRKDRAWAPAPRTADESPTAIVEGRKTPRGVVDPGPTPRADPVPIAVAVGSPAHFNVSRIPYRAVIRLFAPVAIVI